MVSKEDEASEQAERQGAAHLGDNLELLALADKLRL